MAASKENIDRAMSEYMGLGWPRFLAKALIVPGFYVLGLRNGNVIRFGSAIAYAKNYRRKDNSGWVILRDCRFEEGPQSGYQLKHGIDVCLDEIAWVVDAGSSS